MKLYYSPGVCSLASHIVLHQTGSTFEIEKVDLGTKQTETGTDYRTVNPKGSVPALETAEGILTEGPAILQFVADKAGDTTLSPPAGTMARARMQEALNFVASELHTAYSPLFNPAFDDERRNAARGVVAKKLGWIEGLLADGRDFLTGSAFTVADAYAFVVVNWSGLVGVDLADFPKIRAFADRVRSRPAVQQAMQAEGLV
ncbi:glutathione transferase GstA [Cereibacter changlensis]|uniref:glutathione transferase GstA n=1 Tax=Cereibacter changlensis TaxID=402884 RepID=UPI004033D084